MKQCRATRGRHPHLSRCTFNAGHGGDFHFCDGVEWYHLWVPRGRPSHKSDGVGLFEAAGQTAYAHIDILKLVIKARQARLARYQARASSKRLSTKARFARHEPHVRRSVA